MRKLVLFGVSFDAISAFYRPLRALLRQLHVPPFQISNAYLRPLPFRNLLTLHGPPPPAACMLPHLQWLIGTVSLLRLQISETIHLNGGATSVLFTAHQNSHEIVVQIDEGSD